MAESCNQELQTLYEQLLKLVEREEQAIAANHLGELRACTRRKQEIVARLREIESEKGQDGAQDANQGAELVRLLGQVVIRQERATARIQAMLLECGKAILEVRSARRACRAYYRSRKNGEERPAHLV